jgi:plastocyanin
MTAATSSRQVQRGETVAAGWDLTSAVCDNGDSPDDITLDPGETIKCTFTNTKRGHVIDKKVMVGGTSSFTYTGTPAGSINQNNGTISQEVVPGTYTSTEAAQAGWDLTGSRATTATARVTSGPPRRRSTSVRARPSPAPFTNTKRGHILVDKVTVPGGDPTLFTFTPSYNGGQTFQLADASPVNDSGAIVPGTYSVAETVPAGWDLTNTVCSDGSSASAIDLAAGETVTCTFTNTKRGHIIIDKVTDPDGDPALFTFDPSYGDNFNLADETAPNDSGALQPGTYTVVELAKAGWDLTALDCNDNDSSGDVPTATATVKLGAGETVTCTFTNTKRGTIIVEKQTVPDGASGSFTFTGDAAARSAMAARSSSPT